MIIYVDENVPLGIVQHLRAEGYSVEYVTRSLNDVDILEDAYQRQALLITSDKDFERLVLDEHKRTAGVILLRISTRISIEHRAKIVVSVIRNHSTRLQDNFTILTESAIDVHRPLH